MTADALVRLAELRRRQGRLAEAASLFEQAEPHGLALLGRAELAFDRGDCSAAAEQAARYLRRVPPHNRTDRAAGLELLVRARRRRGDLDERAHGARRARRRSPHWSRPRRCGRRRSLRGRMRSRWRRRSSDAARRHFEDAVDRLLQSGAPFEVARARIELARALAALGRADDAAIEAQRAIDLLPS